MIQCKFAMEAINSLALDDTIRPWQQFRLTKRYLRTLAWCYSVKLQKWTHHNDKTASDSKADKLLIHAHSCSEDSENVSRNSLYKAPRYFIQVHSELSGRSNVCGV